MFSSVLGASNFMAPSKLVVGFTEFYVFVHQDILVLLECGVLTVSAQVHTLGGSSGYLIIRITGCVHDNVEKSFIVLVSFKTK